MPLPTTSIRSVLFTSCLFALITACSHNVSAEKNELWHIEYTVSGGIAGIIQGLSIAHDGKYRVHDKKRKFTKSLTASPEQISLIRAQIELLSNNSNSQPLKTPFRRRCADCITQQVLINYKNSKFSHKSRRDLPQNPSYKVLLKILSSMLKQGLAR